jgi:hypothetical protein
MALRLPPQHTLTSTGLWLAPIDDALDHERIGIEEQRATATHPMRRFFAGETRFDLDAKLLLQLQDEPDRWVAPREYIVKGTPVLFELRRLSAKELGRCNTLLNMDERMLEGWLLAAKLGCTDIVGGEADELVWSAGEGGLADVVLNRLAIMPGLLTMLGSAVLTFSQHLTPIEKKP